MKRGGLEFVAFLTLTYFVLKKIPRIDILKEILFSCSSEATNSSVSRAYISLLCPYLYFYTVSMKPSDTREVLNLLPIINICRVKPGYTLIFLIDFFIGNR